MRLFLLLFSVSAGMLFAQSDNPAVSAFTGGEGVNGEVLAVAVQKDGKILIGGRFSSVNGVPRNSIARLNADGTLDRTFVENISDGVNGQVNAIAVDPAGGIIIGGSFTQAGQVESMNIARYNVDGKIDEVFGNVNGREMGANAAVYALAAQKDGKIVVGGIFSTLFGQPRRGIARLNTDGTLDGPVVPPEALSGAVRAIAPTTDGFFVAGGAFTVENQIARSLLKGSQPPLPQ